MSGIFSSFSSITLFSNLAYSRYASLFLDGNSTGKNQTFIDSSASALAMNSFGNPTQGAVSPFPPNKFSALNALGSTHYVSVPNVSTGLDQTGDFTYEGWFNFVTMPTTGYQNTLGNGNANGTYGIYVANAGSNNWSAPYKLKVNRASVGDIAGLTGATTIVAGQWYHFAFTRTSGTTRIFLNGNLEGTGSANDTTSYPFGGSSLFVGQSSNAFFSNVRYVKGTSLYTTTFTPPTSPLTSITGTSFLVHLNGRVSDSSANNLAITTNGTSPAFSAFSPFSEVVYSATTHGGSCAFNYLTSDSFTTPSSTAFALGTGDFTLECWMYNSDVTRAAAIIDFRTSGASAQIKPTLRFTTGSALIYQVNGATAISTGVLVKNSWYHVALSRVSSSTRLFINGVQVGVTYADTNDFGSVTQDVIIGEVGDNRVLTAGYFFGLLSDVRIVKGTGVYSSGFTVPSSSLTAIAGTSLLLKFQAANLIDKTCLNNVNTFVTATTQSTIAKFGSGAIDFTGNGATSDYLTTPFSTFFGFSTRDFTIEFWFYPKEVTSGFQTLIDFRPSGIAAATKPWVSLEGAVVKFRVGGSLTPIVSVAVSAATWNHVAVVRSSGVTTLYLNGFSAGTYADTNDYGASSEFIAGTVGDSRANNTTWSYHGVLDDIRITPSVALYTRNFNPVAALSIT